MFSSEPAVFVALERLVHLIRPLPLERDPRSGSVDAFTLLLPLLAPCLLTLGAPLITQRVAIPWWRGTQR